MGDTPSDNGNDVPGYEHPIVDDATPEHEPGPDTPPDQLIKLIESNELAGARGTYATFLRDMSTITALHWLSQKLRGSAYTEAAAKAGIKRTRAKAIIQCELYKYRHDIFATVHAQAAQHKQKTGRDTYRYPQIGTLLNWYRPDPETTAFPLGPMTNRSDDDLRQDAQQTSDALAEAKQAIEQLRQERRAERIAHDEQIAALERRAIAAELQLAELRAANDHRGSSDPIAVDNHEDIGEPLLPPPTAPASDPWERNIYSSDISAAEYGIIAHRYVRGFYGKRAKDDQKIEELIIRFYWLVGEHISKADRQLMDAQKKSFWRSDLLNHNSNHDYRLTPSAILERAHRSRDKPKPELDGDKDAASAPSGEPP